VASVLINQCLHAQLYSNATDAASSADEMQHFYGSILLYLKSRGTVYVEADMNEVNKLRSYELMRFITVDHLADGRQW